MTNIVKEELQLIIERIERLNEEKSRGFDVPTLREIIKQRKLDDNEFDEKHYLLLTYQKALGLVRG